MSLFLLVVAVVQDSEDRILVRQIVEDAGHRVILCDTCHQALLLMRNGLAPDLLIIACASADLPKGGDRVSLLKSAEAYKVCVIAGQGDVLRREAATVGIQHILDAPITRYGLESAIRKLQHQVVPCAAGDSNASALAAMVHFSLEIPSDMPGPLISRN